MREKKSFKKISDAPVIEAQVRKNRTRHHKEVASSLPDKELFSVNVAKGGLAEKRAKLSKDRFMLKNRDGILKSKTEVAIMKKFAKKNPPVPIAKVNEFSDLWADTTVTDSVKVQKFKNFSRTSWTRIKPVVLASEGQSVNPTQTEHLKVLKQVISEEEKEIEQKYRGSMAQSLHQAAVCIETLKTKEAERKAKEAEKKAKAIAAAEAPKEGKAGKKKEEVSDDEESFSDEVVVKGDGLAKSEHKQPDRLKKLTVNQRN